VGDGGDLVRRIGARCLGDELGVERLLLRALNIVTFQTSGVFVVGIAEEDDVARVQTEAQDVACGVPCFGRRLLLLLFGRWLALGDDLAVRLRLHICAESQATLSSLLCSCLRL